MTVFSPDALRPISVAIVDDDPSVRVSLERLCRAFGLNATTYASGPDFLESLAVGAVSADCLLLDAHMPVMTGSELQRHLVATGIDIPTIVFTADDAPDVPARYAAPGVVAYLRKPLRGKELLTAIEQAVGGKVS